MVRKRRNDSAISKARATLAAVRNEGRLPDRIRRSYWSLRADAKTIYALVADPTFSVSYYPEQRRKSKAIITANLLWWWLRFREVNRYYYLYGLDRVGADMRAVMPYRHFQALRDATNLHPSALAAYYRNSYNFVCIMRDKALFSQVAASLGVPTPETLAICTSESVFWTETKRRAPLEDLVADTTLCIDCVCKPVDGIMGANVFLLEIKNGQLFIDRAKVTIETLRNRLSDRYLLQSRITQHTEIARLHPESVNTLRLLTFNNNGQVELFSAAMRIGTGGRSTDNWAAGGILVAVDRETGVLQADGYLKPGFGKRVLQHPDTGVVFDGFVIPCFEQAVALVREFHDRLPGLHSIGWDLAITPDGPIVIEGNDDWEGAIPMLLEPDFCKRFMAMF